MLDPMYQNLYQNTREVLGPMTHQALSWDCSLSARGLSPALCAIQMPTKTAAIALLPTPSDDPIEPFVQGLHSQAVGPDVHLPHHSLSSDLSCWMGARAFF